MIAILLGITVSVLCLYFLLKALQRPAGYPPGPQWLPIVGNTPQIRRMTAQNGGLLINVFNQLSDRYRSSVIGLKLGQERFVVGLAYEDVKEILSSDVFLGRPDNFFLRLRTMGTRLGVTCTDGTFWNEQRSFVTRYLRRAGYGQEAMHVQIQAELAELLGVLSDRSGKPLWPSSILSISVINVLWTFVTGERVPREDDRLVRLLNLLQERSKAFDMAGGTLNQLPWIRFLAPDWSGYNLLRRFNVELNEFFATTITQHHRDFSEEKATDDLIYAYIKEMRDRRDDPESTSFSNLQLTMVILDMFIAGGQTTSSTLDLAFMMMIMRPDVQQLVHEEIDSQLAPEASPHYGDRTKVPYVEAVLLEVQRFFSIVSLDGPRRTLEDCTLGGYRIPKDTTVLMGLRNVHMDPGHWGDPEVFRPERFLDGQRNIVNTERLMPFGLGKRRCLGETLARSCLFTFFVGVMRQFCLCRDPQAEGDEMAPSMVLKPGITLSPKPYHVVFQPRSTAVDETYYKRKTVSYILIASNHRRTKSP